MECPVYHLDQLNLKRARRGTVLRGNAVFVREEENAVGFKSDSCSLF